MMVMSGPKSACVSSGPNGQSWRPVYDGSLLQESVSGRTLPAGIREAGTFTVHNLIQTLVFSAAWPSLYA